MMNCTRVGVFALGLALLGPGWAYGAGTVDPLRCEAKQLRYDSDLYQCLARCDRVGARQAAGADSVGAAPDDRCDTACYDRRAAADDRMQDKPPCAAIPPEPDPARCEAKLLREDAALMLCRSRCGRRAQQHEGFDLGACEDSCNARHDEDCQQILSMPVCAAGAMRAAERP